ncbi:interleukin-1 beta-like isoform X2 [Protopterus annectens]|uniref:interleukin-1 beta-like isoform X2 n=1 Tax=Protopterus annectens TaxID=7888 RepID=UPI001CFBD667|nr:interleukin-1 beta-like isoform X2 [Protopterus annectens]
MATKCFSPSHKQTTINYRICSENEFYEADFPNTNQHSPKTACWYEATTPDIPIQPLPANSDVHHVSLKSAGEAVIAVIRLAQPLQQSKCFSDKDLLGLLLNCFVEEPVNFINFDEYESDSKLSFKQTAVVTRNIRDTDQKCLVLREESRARLISVHLQGLDSNQEVKIHLSMYKSRSISRQPIALGIAGTNYYLSVSGDASNPILQLEKVQSPDDLRYISSGDMVRFIFYKSGQDASSRFESAAFPEWFIGTSQRTEEEVQMVCRRQDMFTTFMMI